MLVLIHTQGILLLVAVLLLLVPVLVGNNAQAAAVGQIKGTTTDTAEAAVVLADRAPGDGFEISDLTLPGEERVTRMPVLSVDDYLTEVCGVAAASQGGVFIREGTAAEIMYLFDGFDLSSAWEARGGSLAYSPMSLFLEGTVTSGLSEKPVDGAWIQVLSSAHGTTTDFLGDFAIEGVQLGTYTVRVTHRDYRTVELGGVRVETALPTRLDIKLLPKRPW